MRSRQNILVFNQSCYKLGIAKSRRQITGERQKVQTPCGLAITEGLRPMMQRLEEAAAINDFLDHDLLMEKSEQYIELATVKITEKKVSISSYLQIIWLQYLLYRN